MLEVMNYGNARDNFADAFKKAAAGDTVIVTGENDRNAVLISLETYNRLERATADIAYLQMLKESFDQIERGEVVVRTMEELRAMEESGSCES